MTKYPIKFAPQVRTALWGREFWLVSGHPTMPSVVANGSYAGRTLPDLVAEFGADMLGERAADGNGFPLLVKVIEAKDRLSLQVHPNETSAELCGGEPKTEAWYVLDGCESGATIFAGLKEGVAKDGLISAIRNGTAEEQVMRFDVHRGDVLFISGGLIHAIGGGCRIFEVQQTSDTTWRLYDWNRVDLKTGLPRPLHEKEGIACIDWALPPPELLHDDRASSQTLFECRHFACSSLVVSEPAALVARPESFRILFVEDGGCSVDVEGAAPVRLLCGECALIPACDTAISIVPAPRTHLLIAECGGA